MEAKVSFYGVCGKEEFSLAVEDHEEPVQSLQHMFEACNICLNPAT